MKLRWFLQMLNTWLVVWLATGLGTNPVLYAATFHVDPATGDDSRDASQAQDPLTPWASLTRALSEATLAPGDEILLASGIYDVNNGESFPLALVDGVAIRGEGASSTAIVTNTDVVFENDDTDLSSDTWLQDLKLTSDTNGSSDGMYFDVDAASMAPHIDGVEFDSALNYGIYIEDTGENAGTFTGTFSNNTFSNTDGTGVVLQMSSGGDDLFAPVIANNTFNGITTGVDLVMSSYCQGSASPAILDNTFSGGSNGILAYLYPYGGSLEFTPLIAGNTLSGQGNAGISLYLSSVSLSSSANHLSFSPSIIDNRIEGSADEGIALYTEYAYDGELIEHATLAGNTITGTGSQGILVSVSSLSNSGNIDLDYTITNNTVTDTGSTGIEVSLSENYGVASGSFALTIAGNTVTGAYSDGISIDVSSWYSAAVSQHILVAGNTITGSGAAGLSLSLSDQSSLTSNDVQVVDNVVTDNDGNGMYLVSWDYGANPMKVSGNTVVGNAGIGIDQGGSIYPTFAEVDDPAADYGGGDHDSPGLNSIHDNDYYDFYNENSHGVSAQNNYWGSTDLETVDGHIADDEELSSGALDLGTLLEAAPTVDGTATLVTTVQNDVGPIGPSAGDTLRYTATLKGTGQVGCASAVFTAPLPAGGKLVSGSATTSKGLILHAAQEVKAGIQWLAAGDSITVSWDVVVGEDYNCAPLSVQGTLSCNQLNSIATDDPATDDIGDPTVTTLKPSTFYGDTDQDGFGASDGTTFACVFAPPGGTSAVGGDCDDADSLVYPGASEVCNGKDDNCDGQIDEGVTSTFYQDNDEDGFGDPAHTVTACEPGPGVTSDNTDCNDSQADSYPGAPEQCDGRDNDCDGQIDQGLTLTTFYQDKDSDGFGNSAVTEQGCVAPGGYVSDDTDCDDSIDTIYPGAPETCNGKDDNCDGSIDEGVGDTTYYQDKDSDGYGNAAVTVTACSVPDGYVANSKDCDDKDKAVHPGAKETCDETDNNCDGSIDEGVTSTYYQDSDGDGYGNPDQTVTGCSAPNGYVTDHTDCSDADATAHAESTWYADTDADGYGDPADSQQSCGQPAGYVADNTDNCPTTANADQADSDSNGVGDACDTTATATPDVQVEGNGCACNTTSTTPPGAGMLLSPLLLVGLFFRRRNRFAAPVRSSRRSPTLKVAVGVGTVAGALVAGAAGTARAQSAAVDIQQFAPQPGGDSNYLNLMGGQTVGSLNPSFGLYANYAHRPLSVVTGGNSIDLVASQAQVDVLAALGLGKAFQLGVAMPVTVFQTNTVPSGSSLPVVASQALGDLRAQIKWAALQRETGPNLAIAVNATAPTGSEADLQGNTGFTVDPALAFEWRFSDRFRAALNAGYILRGEEPFFNLTIGNEVHYGLGAELVAVPEKLAFLAEGFGRVAAGSGTDYSVNTLPLEVNVAARLWLAKGHAITLGGGPGLTRGYGTPLFRAFLGYTWTPSITRVKDRDHDGLADDADQCPDEAEDMDGYKDDDGCPDPDNDGDGVVDARDKCPAAAEDKDGFQDDDGCPDPDNDGDGLADDQDKCPNEAETKNGIEDEDGCPEKDSDGDGLIDAQDKCPEEAETKNGIEDEDGCPEKDSDGDGLIDAQDKCPNKAETKNGYKDEDGCPEKDTDKDGIVDDLDKCPKKPETVNAFEDEDGCPDKAPEVKPEPTPAPEPAPEPVKPAPVKASGEKAPIKMLLFFDFDKTELSARSLEVLSRAEQFLKDHPGLNVRVQGFTDNLGGDTFNRTLSQKRADAVRQHLIDNGIDPKRITAKGFGEKWPRATNATDSGRAENRRVRILPIDQKGRYVEQLPVEMDVPLPAGGGEQK